jgi:hypothetical protein
MKAGKVAIRQKERGDVPNARADKGKIRAKGVPAVSEGEGGDGNTGSDQEEERTGEAPKKAKRVATKRKMPVSGAHRARKSAPAAGKRKREEEAGSGSGEGEGADTASEDGGINAEDVEPVVKKAKKGQDKTEVVQTVRKAAALTAVTTSGSGSGSTSTAPARKKINLSGKTGGAFNWGGLGAGGLSGGGGVSVRNCRVTVDGADLLCGTQNILGIPDVLSPIKKSR